MSMMASASAGSAGRDRRSPTEVNAGRASDEYRTSSGLRWLAASAAYGKRGRERGIGI